jgi:hypothetical protein
MKLECIASALNIRQTAGGAIIGELRQSDIVTVANGKSSLEWVEVTAISGVSAGQSGFVRRKWLCQHYESPPAPASGDRTAAAEIITRRTYEFDAVTYGLGSKARGWMDLGHGGVIDCSGWVYLLAKEILSGTSASAFATKLYTYSDEQITKVGDATGEIVSGRFLTEAHFVPGTLVGIDFAEYSWDRRRPLDVDHIVAIGSDASGRFVSQSSSSGGGVNRVEFSRWFSSLGSLPALGRVHLVDLLALP